MTQTVQLPIADLPPISTIGGKARAGLRRRPVRRARPGHRAGRSASVADGTVEDALAAVDAAPRRRPRLGRDAPRASAPRSCAGAFELMTAAGRASWPS